jgi:membrane spanning protein
MMFIQFVVSLFATLSFAVLFSAPKVELVFCGITGALGWIVYLACLGANTGKPIANLIAALTLTLVARFFSAARKKPATIYLLCGIFPLVPGAGIYYTSYYFIMNQMDLCGQAGMDTVKVAGAIVLGILFGFALPQSWFNALGRRF